MAEAARRIDYVDAPATPDDACQIVGDALNVPPGVYEAAFDTWDTQAYWNGKAKKLVLWFALTKPGFMGVRLPKYYNVRDLVGAPRKRGRFRVGRKSDFVRDFYRLHGSPDRSDRLAVSQFGNALYRVRVRMVTDYAPGRKGQKRGARKLHPDLHYPVIAEVLEKIR